MTLMLKLVILAAVALNISLETLVIELRIRDDGKPNMRGYNTFLREAGFLALPFSVKEDRQATMESRITNTAEASSTLSAPTCNHFQCLSLNRGLTTQPPPTDTVSLSNACCK
jgi:hypothetical protein